MSLPIRPLASLQRAVFLINSRLSRFAAAFAGSGSKSRHPQRHPFFRSYGAILPSSLTWFLPRTLVFSTRLPVSVCGTDPRPSTLRSFSWQHSRSRFASSVDSASRRASGLRPADLPIRSPCALGPPIPSDGRPGTLRHSIAPVGKYRNINLWSIDYAFRPRLRIRLTLGGRTCPRKPWAFGEQDSHLFYRYSCLHFHWRPVHRPSRGGFDPGVTLSYPRPLNSRQRRMLSPGSAAQPTRNSRTPLL